MTENEMEKELIIKPFIPEPQEDTKTIDSPETIVRDLLRTEKEIALETLRMVRSKYERERFEWEKLFGAKERDLSGLKARLDDSENRINNIRLQLEEEKQKIIAQFNQKAKELENQRLSAKKKWEIIGDEVKEFSNAAQAARVKLIGEQENLIRVKNEAQKKEKNLISKLSEKEEEISQLKVQLINKEEDWLKFKSEKGDEIRLLNDNMAALKITFENDKLDKSKVIEKNGADIKSLSKALQDTVIQLNMERQQKADALEQAGKQNERVLALEEELKKTVGKYEADREEWTGSVREEQASWERYKMEFVNKEEVLRRDTEEQVSRILKSVEIIEQQLADEQSLKKAAEEKLKAKDEEIRKLLLQKDEITVEWRKMLTSEQELRISRQAELLGEFDKVKAAREEDFKILRNEINNLSAALAEENKLYAVEKEQNKQLLQKIAYLEENRLGLIGQLESKEKTWREAIEIERDMFKRQMEETRNALESQLKSRDNEIMRLDEDLSMLNGQTLELRQKLSLEKNENNNRLERISEFESQMKSITGNYNQERTEWHKKFQFIQQQWDEQRNSLLTYQKDMESRYEKDIKAYEDRIKELNGKINIPQQKTRETGSGQLGNNLSGEIIKSDKYDPNK